MKSKLLRRICAIALAVTVIGGASISTGLLSIQADAAVQVLSLEETTASLQSKPETRPTASNPTDLRLTDNNGGDKYEDDIYTVPVYLYSRYSADENTMSMANGAVKHTAKIQIKDGNAYLILGFNAITLDFGEAGALIGHLQNLWYYDENGRKQDTINKKLDYVYSTEDLSDVYSILEETTIPLWDLGTAKKPVYPTEIVCRVKVDAMGDSEQDCNLVIDWNNLRCSEWTEKVEPMLEECKSIIANNDKYTQESVNKLQSSVTAVENANNRDKYYPLFSMRDYAKLVKAKSGLVEKDKILADGVYKAKVKFYETSFNTPTYDSGYGRYTEDGILTDKEIPFFNEYFGDTVEITAQNGNYTLKFVPVDNYSDTGYYVGSISAYSSTYSVWGFQRELEFLSRTSVDYFGENLWILTNQDSTEGTIANQYSAESLITRIVRFKTDEKTLPGEFIDAAMDIDWKNIEYVGELKIDKSDLELQIGATKALIESDAISAYTSASVQNLKDVLSKAQQVLDDDTSSQKLVDSSAEELKAARQALEKKATNEQMETINTLMAQAQAINNDDGKYTEDSFAGLQQFLFIANYVLSSSTDVSEQSANLIISGLQEAINGLVEIAPTVLTNTAAIDSDTIQLGTSLTVNMGAEGGEGDYTYSVLYKKAYGTKWAVAQKPTTDTAATVKPAAAGQYYVMVKVKDAGGNVAKKHFVVNVENNLKNTSALSADSIKKGESVTVKAAAEGTTSDYQYAVMYKKLSSDKWAGVQKYDANAEITFTPAAATEYEVCVKARDNNGAVAKKYFIVSVTK